MDILATDSPYRGRLAPSPTGLLHLGHARTFWIAAERAIAAAGALVLRNEDLDAQRSRSDFAQAMLEDLRWLGIRWQEGPDLDPPGPFGPYSQSQRRGFYLHAWSRLLADGWIYPCQCSRRELAQAAQAPHESASDDAGHEEDEEPLYPGTCRPAAAHPVSVESPAGVNWRFRVPDGEAVEFTDGHLGPQCFRAGRDFGDFLVWRRDDVPAYQLAAVVDDAAMRITEVVRGADLLKSTARQILLARALQVSSPAWYHCDLLRDAGGRRLAKRHDALSLRALREQGRSPEEVCSMFPPP